MLGSPEGRIIAARQGGVAENDCYCFLARVKISKVSRSMVSRVVHLRSAASMSMSPLAIHPPATFETGQRILFSVEPTQPGPVTVGIS
jgi:hypothetical protein